MEVILGGTWQPGSPMASEPELSSCASAWTASLGPAHRGMGEVVSSAHAWHTLTWLWSAFLPLPPEYKKKYGEEHGSCQAGMSGFFTEVGVSHVAFISFPFWVFGPFQFVVGWPWRWDFWCPGQLSPSK